jgi:hypothetical protein
MPLPGAHGCFLQCEEPWLSLELGVVASAPDPMCSQVTAQVLVQC